MNLNRTALRKTARAILCLVIITALSACAPASGTSSPANNTESKTDVSDKYTGTSPVFREPFTVSILSTNGASRIMGLTDMPWWQEVLKRAYVVLDLEEIDPSSYNDVVRPRLAAAADLPDIVFLNGRDNDMSYINSGIFVDLTDYYENYGFNLKKQFEEHPSLKAELTTPDGRIFYVPNIYNSANNTRALMMNMGYVSALGMSVDNIKTVDDFYDYLVAVKNNDANGNGDASDEIPLFCRAGMVSLWAMYWGLDITDTGGYQVGPDGKVICGYTDNRFREYVTFMNKLYTEELLYSEFSTANYDTQAALLAGNQVGSLIHFLANCTGYSQQINPEWDFDNDEPIIQGTSICCSCFFLFLCIISSLIMFR